MRNLNILQDKMTEAMTMNQVKTMKLGWKQAKREDLPFSSTEITYPYLFSENRVKATGFYLQNLVC